MRQLIGLSLVVVGMSLAVRLAVAADVHDEAEAALKRHDEDRLI
jgi:hypothetical protein